MTRIAFWRNGQGFLYDGLISLGGDDGFYEDNATGTQTLSGVFRNFSIGKIRQTRSNRGSNSEEVKSGPIVRTEFVQSAGFAVSVTPRKTERSGLMAVGLNRTHTARQTHS